VSNRTRRSAASPEATTADSTVTASRRYCCGPTKSPSLGHAAQLRDLRQALDGSATVRATACLDARDHASAEGRKAGGRPVWGRHSEPSYRRPQYARRRPRTSAPMCRRTVNFRKAGPRAPRLPACATSAISKVTPHQNERQMGVTSVISASRYRP
jgi:hypothetical protein